MSASNALSPESGRAAARRRFLAGLAACGAALLLRPAPAAAEALSEADPTAQALGYRIDAQQVDAARYPQHTPAQTCASCGFFQGRSGDGPCQLFPGKTVSAKGWCAGYKPKA